MDNIPNIFGFSRATYPGNCSECGKSIFVNEIFSFVCKEGYDDVIKRGVHPRRKVFRCLGCTDIIFDEKPQYE